MAFTVRNRSASVDTLRPEARLRYGKAESPAALGVARATFTSNREGVVIGSVGSDVVEATKPIIDRAKQTCR